MHGLLSIERINEIIEAELECARQVNPQMALGIIKIQALLNEEAGEVNEQATWF